MPRDYSSRRNSSKKSTNGRKRKKAPAVAKQRHGLPGFVWMFFGLTVGLMVAAWVYFFQPTPPDVGSELAEAAGIKSKPVKAKAEEKTNELPPKKKPKYAFYEMLPNYEIVVPQDSNGSASSKKTRKEQATLIEEPGQYIIQAGSFRDFEEADRRKARMAMLGVESNIKKVTIAGEEDDEDDQVWYRVQVGPNSNLQRVNATLRTLEKQGIDSLLIRIKG